MHTVEMYNRMKTWQKNQGMKDLRVLVNKRRVMHGMGSTHIYSYSDNMFFPNLSSKRMVIKVESSNHTGLRKQKSEFGEHKVAKY